MSTAVATIEELGDLPAAPPARPRVLLIGTLLATVATVMAFTAMLGFYLQERASAIVDGDTWLPDGVSIPLTPGTMGLVTLTMSCVTMQWAVDAMGRDDRRHTWMALALTMLFGAAQLNGMAFYYTQMGLAGSTPQGALIYAITGAHLAMVGAGMLFIALMAFRTLGGRYSARDREGVVAASLFWYATVAVYSAIWYAIFVTK